MEFATVVLWFLAGAAVRSLVLALPALVLTAILTRRRSAAARHAVLFVIAAGMLSVAVLTPLLPVIPLHILPAPAATPLPPLPASTAAFEAAPSAAAAEAVAAPPFAWAVVPVALYFAGLAVLLSRLLFGALFTRRLLRAATPVDAIDAADLFESSWISVPLTVGWLRPRILLPAGWREWDPAKLEAVLAHERNHIHRADWAISLVAAFNRSLYWFNPLAWWLERRLATLAEQACDDAALLALGSRESYAQALLDMAAAVKIGQGRLVWEAMAMAKGAEVRMRIERILDDDRPIPRGLTRSRWLALVACSLPLIYLTAALRPAPAQSREPDRLPPAIAQLLHSPAPLTPGGAAQLEQHLAANPDDLQVREQLILYYFANGIRDPRLSHIDWLISNHPESKEAALTSLGITPQDSSFNTAADYRHAADLWRQQAASHSTVEQVLVNAGRFFGQPGGDPNEAERLLLQARGLGPSTTVAVDALAQLYSSAILGTSGDPQFPNSNPDFGNRVRAEIDNLKDGSVMFRTGLRLTDVARVPRNGETLPPGTLNLSEHPLLIPVTELGARLTAQGGKLAGETSPTSIDALRARAMSNRGAPPPPTGASVTVTSPPVATIESANANAALPVISPAPLPISATAPVYPPLARQARIQGIVTLNVVIAPDGHVTNLRVLRGHPLLVQPAMDAVRQWVYPAVSQAGTFEEQVNFTLPPGEASAPNRGPLPQAATTEPKPPTPQRIKIGGNVQAAMLIRHVDPDYPALARQANIQGTVVLSIIIGKDGTVQDVSPLEGPAPLISAAETAVKQWAYKPTLLNGDPVEVSTTVSVPFQLQ